MLSNSNIRVYLKPNPIIEHKNWPEQYCTACGDSLEDFCFSEVARDPEAVQKVFADCKKKHKFIGGQCAKLFIAGAEIPDELSPNSND